MYPVFIADATNGSYLQRLSFESITSTAATVCRVFISDTVPTISAGALVSNTSLNTHKIGEISLPLVTVSQTVAAPHLDLMVNSAIKAGYRISVTFGTSTGASTTGWSVVAFGGDY
jgi:hypothetical protein